MRYKADMAEAVNSLHFNIMKGVKPDLITMAKGMGNGFPIGGVLIHP